MKRTLSFMVMALALLLTQCRKPEVKFPTPSSAEGVTVSMTVTAGPGSKTDITDEGAITWSKGDKLYVGFDGKYVGCLELVGDGGFATGTFTGNVTLTDITEGIPFHFFYLGSGDYTSLKKGESTTVDVDFSSQNIYADVNNKADDNKKLVNASAQHVGYGSANGTVTNGAVTGINVTLVSKVALARFSFTDGTNPYTGELTLSGTHIYNSMTVNFGGTCTPGTNGNISLAAGHAERYVMLVPPTGVSAEDVTFKSGNIEGGATFNNGIEANKFYGQGGPMEVTVTESPYVDLGLSVRWAKCNLGAEHPYDYGDYYAWGEILPYYDDGHSQDNPCNTWRSMTTGAGNTDLTSGYAWESYSQDGSSSFAEWTTKPYGDGSTLTSDYDAATQEWGSDWRMPTLAEFTELINNTNRSWTKENGVDGWKCANMSDPTKYIFLPAAGYRDGKDLYNAGSSGKYWSSTLVTFFFIYKAYACVYGSASMTTDGPPREQGCPVRPVYAPQN